MAQALKPPLFFPSPCKGHPNLVFDLIGPTDVNEVSEFVMNEFFHRFPLRDILQVDKEVRPWIGSYIAHVCDKNFSVNVLIYFIIWFRTPNKFRVYRSFYAIFIAGTASLRLPSMMWIIRSAKPKTSTYLPTLIRLPVLDGTKSAPCCPNSIADWVSLLIPFYPWISL